MDDNLRDPPSGCPTDHPGCHPHGPNQAQCVQDEANEEEETRGIADHGKVHVDLALGPVPKANRRSADTSDIEL